MLELSALCRRKILSFLVAFGLLLVVDRSALGDVDLPPLRMPNLAVGTRCFGLLPCTAIDPFGIRLRAAALAIFRPERGHDRDLYAARIQLAPSITLFEWAEVGVAIPITLYKKDIGVSPVYEPLQPFGRVRLPLDSFLGGLATTAFVRVHIAHGPFVGGLPPELTAQAGQSYQAQTQFELGLALLKRIGPMTVTGAVSASVASQRIELSGGVELGYRWNLLHAFVQGMGIGVPKCPPEEAALNFCARGFRFAAGVRFDFDIGQGGLMIGTGSGAVEPGWMVGAQLGLDYDEHVRWMHGDGTEAAHAWWERRFEAMAQGWAAWKAAAVVWEDEEEALRRAQHPRRGPFSEVLGPEQPPASSPWLDGLLGAPPLTYSPLPEVPAGTSPPSPAGTSPAVQSSKAKPPSARKPPSRSLFNEANARAARARQLVQVPQLSLPSGLDRMADDELSRLQWQVIQEELRRADQQKWRDASPLPPMEKVILNWVATAPARGVLGLLAMSGPGRRAEAEEQLRKLRPLKCTPAEEEACGAVEQLLDMMATTLVPSAAEAVAAERSMLALARQAAREAGHAAEFVAAEQALGLAEEGSAKAAELGGSRVSQFLDSIGNRLNPMNYEVRGLGSNFGNVGYRGPRAPAGAASVEATQISAQVGEKQMAQEVAEFLQSPQMAEIRAAQASGKPVSVQFQGRTIQYEPGLPASGMTMFGENGYVIGREAFTSEAELTKTLLHETHRLTTSSVRVTGATAQQATSETQAAFDFAERTYKSVLQGKP